MQRLLRSTGKQVRDRRGRRIRNCRLWMPIGKEKEKEANLIYTNMRREGYHMRRLCSLSTTMFSYVFSSGEFSLPA